MDVSSIILAKTPQPTLQYLTFPANQRFDIFQTIRLAFLQCLYSLRTLPNHRTIHVHFYKYFHLVWFRPNHKYRQINTYAVALGAQYRMYMPPYPVLHQVQAA